MAFLGLIFEVLLLLLGVYIYLFSRGLLKVGNAAVRERAEVFRKENAGWMRLLGLALAAVMLINILLRLK